MTTVSNILAQIDNQTILLPEFQRGYVWNRDQVRGLMRSLYLGYPVGALLIWETAGDTTSTRGLAGGDGIRQLLLDGQQRVTSLYGVIRDRPPEFFEGDASAFTRLHFNVETETFEFYAPAKMKDDALWVDVTALFVRGLEPQIERLNADQRTHLKIVPYLKRLTRLHSLLDRDFHAEKITGSDKTVDVVVDIFNRVNSGGTKLSKGDLALAKICAEWPEARPELREKVAQWQEQGYSFTLDWLLRNVNAVATGRAPFSALEGTRSADFQQALQATGRYISNFLDVVAGRLGLDHDRVLMGRYAFPVVSRLLHLRGGHFADAAERDRVLYWYVHSALWGRFAGSTETVLAQDYETIERSGIDGLIASLQRSRAGNLTISSDDFAGFGRGSRFYPLLYLLTRVRGARDFGSGLPLHSHMLGHLATLQVHHLFPKALLYEHGYSRGQVNAVANFCFLTQETNLAVGKREPQEYFRKVEARHPGALASQWIPSDPELWQVERYPEFLSARRDLIASAANTLLAELRSGEDARSAPALERVTVVATDDEVDDRAARVQLLLAELHDLGCAPPRIDSEIADPETGRVLAIAEAFWPLGLQPGQGAAIVLELDEAEADLPRLEELGYEVFTSVQALRAYARRRNRIAAGVVAAGDNYFTGPQDLEDQAAAVPTR